LLLGTGIAAVLRQLNVELQSADINLPESQVLSTLIYGDRPIAGRAESPVECAPLNALTAAVDRTWLDRDRRN
jgi:hypothetical protein